MNLTGNVSGIENIQINVFQNAQEECEMLLLIFVLCLIGTKEKAEERQVRLGVDED